MGKIEFSIVRDRVIDGLAEICPELLADAVYVEGMLFLLMREIFRAVQQEREEQPRRIREVSAS